jgi:hypothetical protein
MSQSDIQHHSLTRRAKLSNEWHARPTAQMQTPFRCTHEVFVGMARAIGGKH